MACLCDVAQLSILLAISLTAAYALSGYLAKLISWGDRPAYRWLAWLEHHVLRAIGADGHQMAWREYLSALLATNAAAMAIGFVLLMLQGRLLPGAELTPDLAFNIASSFVTNTDLQHYAGHMLSIASQVSVITYAMFVAPASGLAASFAFIRGFLRKGSGLGNFYVDFIRASMTVLLPLAFVSALILVALGVPQTLQQYVTASGVSGIGQVIRLGPVASLESIKLLGNNGGGYFAANSAYTLENPSGLSNFYESFLMLLLPISLPLSFGRLLGLRRGATFAAAMLAGAGLLLLLALLASPGLGIEPRLGAFNTILFNSVSMVTNTGASASSLYAMSPAAVTSFLMAMFVQAVPGAVGVGFMYIMVYAVLTLFIVGLMVGKTPEIMGMRISPGDVKIATFAFLVHPLIILVPTVAAFATGQAQHLLGQPGPLSFTAVLYEFTSAAANNGSDYLGALANSQFWNWSTSAVMLAGRYVPMALMLMLAGSFAGKDRRRMPEPVETQGVLFAVVLLGMTFLLTVLTFFPFIALGPLSMW